jgi:hypothetical protein
MTIELFVVLGDSYVEVVSALKVNPETIRGSERS